MLRLVRNGPELSSEPRDPDLNYRLEFAGGWLPWSCKMLFLNYCKELSPRC